MSQRDAIVFTAALLSALSFVAVLLVLWLQRREFRAVPRADWLGASRNGMLGWLAGLGAIFALGLLLPNRPLLDATHEATDLTVVTAIFAGLGMMLLGSSALNITLYMATGRLSRHQAKWTAAVIAVVYLAVVAGFSAAVLA